MNKPQIAKNGMYKKLLVFFSTPANATVWASFARLVTEIANFVNLNTQLDNYINQQAIGTTGTTNTKTAAFNTMVDDFIAAAAKAYVWAIDNNQSKLVILFDIHKTDLINTTDANALATCYNIYSAINANIATMASVKLVPADVLALKAAYDAFKLQLSAPGDAEAIQVAATQGIEAMMTPIDDSLTLITKLLTSTYQTSNPALIDQFNQDSKIDNLPVHHSGIHTHITNNANATNIEGATITITELGKTSTSDIMGIADIIKVKSGTYHLVITATGYTTQNQIITIKRGVINTMEIKLVHV